MLRQRTLIPKRKRSGLSAADIARLIKFEAPTISESEPLTSGQLPQVLISSSPWDAIVREKPKEEEKHFDMPQVPLWRSKDFSLMSDNERTEYLSKSWMLRWMKGREAQLQANYAAERQDFENDSDYMEAFSDDLKGMPTAELEAKRYLNLIDTAKFKFHNMSGLTNEDGTVTLGVYNSKHNTVSMFNPKASDAVSTAVHELGHAMGSGSEWGENYQTESIRRILGETKGWVKGNNGVKPGYLNRPGEIYSRMMQYRYESGLDPSDKVTKKNLDRNLMKKLNLDFGDDDTSILRLLNEVAQNSPSKENSDYLSYAKTRI